MAAPEDAVPEIPVPEISVLPVTGLPEVTAGTDLAALIAGAVPDQRDGDLVAITSSIVSNADSRVIAASRNVVIEAETVWVGSRR